MIKAHAQKLAEVIIDIYSDEIAIEFKNVNVNDIEKNMKKLYTELYYALLNDTDISSPVWYLRCKINEVAKNKQNEDENEFAILLSNQFVDCRYEQNKEFIKVKSSRHIFSILSMLSKEEEEMFLLYYRDKINAEQLAQKYKISESHFRTLMAKLKKKIVYLYNINYSNDPPIKYKLSNDCVVDIQHKALYLHGRIVSFPVKEHYWNLITALVEAKLKFTFLTEKQMCQIAGIEYANEAARKVYNLTYGLNRHLGQGIVTKTAMGYTLKNYPEKIPKESHE